MAARALKPCCQDPQQREVVEVEGPFTTERCRVCACRHIILALDLAEVLFGHRGVQRPRRDEA